MYIFVFRSANYIKKRKSVLLSKDQEESHIPHVKIKIKKSNVRLNIFYFKKFIITKFDYDFVLQLFHK